MKISLYKNTELTDEKWISDHQSNKILDKLNKQLKMQMFLVALPKEQLRLEIISFISRRKDC